MKLIAEFLVGMSIEVDAKQVGELVGVHARTGHADGPRPIKVAAGELVGESL